MAKTNHVLIACVVLDRVGGHLRVGSNLSVGKNLMSLTVKRNCPIHWMVGKINTKAVFPNLSYCFKFLLIEDQI
jgi:hypothetical protein